MEALSHPLQNRAYAASQLADLAQKLTKAQTAISSTKAPAPSLKDDKQARVCHSCQLSCDDILTVFDIQKEEKKKEDQNQLLKSVRDRYDICSMALKVTHPARCRSDKIASEGQHGLIAQVLKDVIFSMRPQDAARSEVSEIMDTTMAIG